MSEQQDDGHFWHYAGIALVAVLMMSGDMIDYWLMRWLA